MTAPNIEVGSSTQYLGYGGDDGVKISANPRSNPKQGLVQAEALSSITSYNANGGALAQTAANSCANQAITATGLLTTDFIVGITKPTAQANFGIGGAIISANDAVNTLLCTANGAITATANQTYSVTALRGAPVISANLTPAAVVTKTTSEQVFTITPSGAAATATISNKVVTQVSVTAGGAGYHSVPETVFTSATGSGASGVAIIVGGVVVGVQVTAGGSGYETAPTVSFVGGNNIALGMVVAVNKAAYQANLGIGNVRVAGNNQIAITYFVNGAANITPTANETYKIYAFNKIPAASPIIQITANLANLTAAAANASNKTDITVEGIAAGDMLLVMNKALASPLLFGGGNCAANTVTIHYGAGVPGATPANGVYSVGVLKNDIPAPVNIGSISVTPTSIGANTSAEIVFTLPTGFTVQANSTITVNKPTHTPGISILGARANSTTTVGITYQNNTAVAIVPPAETYLIANFPSYPPSISANQIEGYCIQIVNSGINGLLDQSNEQQQALVQIGAIKGH